METAATADPPARKEMAARPGYAFAVRELLTLPSLAGATLAAGERGLDQSVTGVNVMEVPDILPWVKPSELLLTTGFPLLHSDGEDGRRPQALADLVAGLAERQVAALGVKTGRYLDELPARMLAEADRRRFPVLLLPAEVAFDDVFSEVFSQLVHRQSAALEVADRMHRALTAIVLEGGDLPQLAGEVASLIGAAVLVCSPDGRIQTVAGEPADTSALAALPLFDPSGRFFAERMRAGLSPAPDGCPGQFAVAPVAAASADHGLIVAYSPQGGLSPVTVQALERAATVAALAITKQLAVAAVESKFRGDFLRDALTGNAGSPDQVVAHCAELGWDVDRPLVVLVAALDQQQPGAAPPVPGRTAQDRLTAAWQQVVRARDRAAPVVGFSHEVVALLPVGADDPAELVAGLVAAVTGDRGGGRRSFSAGVSRVIRSAADLPAGYDQARKAVAIGRRMRGPGAVAHFDSLGVHRLLSLVSDSAELRAFAAEVLGPLAADNGEADDLRRTLQALLDTNCNVAEAARALHFHYNTLRYRIGKLEAIIGPFTADPHLRLDAALALRILQMRGL